MAAKRILVIDDEPDTRTYFSSLLEDNGYVVSEAANGEEGLRMARSVKPDLITLDVTMPEQSGVRCYRELRSDEALKSVPVVIITGVSDDFKQFISSRRQVPPPDGFIHKPVEPEEMLKLIHGLVS